MENQENSQYGRRPNPSGLRPKRFKLEGVPPIGFYGNAQKLESVERCPENIPIPSAVRAIMEFRGEGLGCHKAGMPGICGTGDLACGYAFLIGVSGAAFYTCWDTHWNQDCVSIAYLGRDFETAERRCLSALGYTYEWVQPNPDGDYREEWLERIQRSLLERQMPVLSYGIIGPPEPAIITGWDADGDILMGWSYFQTYPWNSTDDFEPDGQFRKRNWIEGNLCLLVIGEKGVQPDLIQVYHDALEWALQVFRIPKMFPEPEAREWVAAKWNGKAALEVWQAALLDDSNFPDDANILRQHHLVHNSVAGNLAEARAMANVFLQQIAAAVPQTAEHLLYAGKHYQAERELVKKMWSICAGLDEASEWQKLSRREIRSSLANIIGEMLDKEEQAIQCIENALSNW